MTDYLVRVSILSAIGIEMTEIFSQIHEALGYAFVQRAVLAGVLWPWDVLSGGFSRFTQVLFDWRRVGACQFCHSGDSPSPACPADGRFDPAGGHGFPVILSLSEKAQVYGDAAIGLVSSLVSLSA
jgi:hypothetical protein